MQFFLRILVAVVVVILVRYVLPAVLHILGFPLSGDLEIILNAVILVLALAYIIWGRPVPNPFA